MRILFILNIIVLCEIKTIFGNVESEIREYFTSDTFNTIQIQWQTQRKSFESAISLILEENYGHRGMNVYVRKVPDSFKISKGFYFCDNVIDIAISDLHLQELPSLIAPDVTFALASNFLHVDAKLSKMIMRSQYFLIRNQSEIVFMPIEQDTLHYSPFSFQQVQDNGELTIIADDCSLVGYTITTLKAESVDLGVNTFKVTNCKFTIEIFTEGLGSPPVIAPYFSKEQGESLERMLAKPIRAEIMAKLQAAVYSYVNTSYIFQKKLPQLRFRQKNIFKKTAKFMNLIVKNFVQSTIKDNQGILQLNPLEFMWDKTCLDESCRMRIALVDPILYGLDTAYSSHSGGPYKLHSTKIVEEIRFSTMQVRGKICLENSTMKGEHAFAVELRDVAFNVEMEAKSSSYLLRPAKMDFVGWRSIEFSIIGVDIFENARRLSQSLIKGHLINEIPSSLLDHLSNTFGDVKIRDLHYSDNTTASEIPAQSDENNNKSEDNLKETGDNKLAYIYDDDTEKFNTDESSEENRRKSYAKKLLHPSDNEVK